MYVTLSLFGPLGATYGRISGLVLHECPPWDDGETWEILLSLLVANGKVKFCLFQKKSLIEEMKKGTFGRVGSNLVHQMKRLYFNR